MPVGTGLNQVPTQIREVTSLAPSGPGSLADAIANNAGGAGVIVDFDVEGNCNRIGMPNLQITQPGIHIRGENAPGDGYNLVGCGLTVKSSNTVVSGFRIAPGDRGTVPSPQNRDSLALEGEAQDIFDVLIRWMTLAYSVDGILDLWSTRGRRISVIENIFAEPLHASIHPEGNHSTHLLIGPGTQDVLIAGNFFASGGYRVPAIHGNVTGAFVNNYCYNPANKTWEFYGGTTPAATLFDIIGNVVQIGPSSPKHRTTPTGKMEVINGAVHSGTRCYKSGNLTTVHPDLVAQDARFGQFDAFPDSTPGLAGLPQFFSAAPTVSLPLTPMAASAVKAYVLASAGPRRADGTLRDGVLETRLRAEATDGRIGSLKSTLPAAEAAYFGFPNLPPLTYGDIDDAPILAGIKALAESSYPDNQVTDTTLLPSATRAAILAVLDTLDVGAGQSLTVVDAVRQAAMNVAAEAEALVESIDRQTANNSKPYWQG